MSVLSEVQGSRGYKEVTNGLIVNLREGEERKGEEERERKGEREEGREREGGKGREGEREREREREKAVKK